VTTSFGEEDRRLSYGSYLRIPELLSLQEGRTEAHDELLFIVVHQAYELWFKVLLDELEATRDRMAAGEISKARHHLTRVRVIEKLLVEQIDVLETMAPQDFLAFRAELAPASGFQSIQFREIEFLSGLKDHRYLDRLEVSPEESERLDRRLAEPSLWEAFLTLLGLNGSPSLQDVYRGREDRGELYALAEALLDHDANFALWRSRHVLMVERQIGSKTGTGGSTGASYLRSTLEKRFFPELWEVRSRL